MTTDVQARPVSKTKSLHGHPISTTIGFLAIAAVCYVLLLGMGPTKMSPVEVIEVLTGGGTRQAINVVWDLRLPVAVATVVVGAALGLAGSWTITMTRNPLASPDFLGVSGGASVMVVAGTSFIGPALSLGLSGFWARAGLAMIGSLLVLGLLIALGGFGGSRRIVLIGFSLSLMCQSAVSYMLLKAEINSSSQSQLWLAGSTGMVRSDAILPLVLGVIPFVLIASLVGHQVKYLAHDDDTALTLGIDISRVRTMLLICATGLVAVTVSVVGPITFVALVAPHLARLVARTPVPTQWASAAAGAAILSACAVATSMLPISVPVGLMTSIFGGVCLVLLTLVSLRKTSA